MNSLDLIKLLTSLYSYYQKNKDILSSTPKTDKDNQQNRGEKVYREQNSTVSDADNRDKTSGGFSNDSPRNGSNGFDMGFLKNIFPFLSKPKPFNPNESTASATREPVKKLHGQKTPMPINRDLFNAMHRHEEFVKRVIQNNSSTSQPHSSAKLSTTPPPRKI